MPNSPQDSVGHDRFFGGRRLVVLAGFFLASYLVAALAAGSSYVFLDLLDAIAAPFHGDDRSVPEAKDVPLALLESSLGLAIAPASAAVLATLAAMQTLMLVPIAGPLRIHPNGASLLASVIGAAGIAGFLTAMAAFAGVELLQQVFDIDLDQLLDRSTFGGIALAFLVWSIAGAFWCWLLRRAGRSRDPKGLDRLVRLVFAATVVELLLTVPIYVMLRKKLNCHCFSASFLSIVGGLAVLLWMCGPWTLLLLTRRHREAWSSTACTRCGYPRRGVGRLCPECGLPYPIADAAGD